MNFISVQSVQLLMRCFYRSIPFSHAITKHDLRRIWEKESLHLSVLTIYQASI